MNQPETGGGCRRPLGCALPEECECGLFTGLQTEIVPLDEPSMEDYPAPKERPVVKIHDGVRDTTNR